jgi:BirA family transcriptional regulator, biotin operon repressor / biotin---[acetyl-CoA-carboxylase] ligase
MPDSLAPENVEPLFRGGFGLPYRYETSCESTQRLLSPDAPEGAVATCDEQTAGRGRLGRSWEAPAGKGLLVSILLRPPADRRVAELSLVGGVAAALTVESALGLSAQIKWPNDVMVNRSKVAGVLAETSEGVVVLGIGLNVNQTRDELPQDGRVPVGSLLTTDAVERERAPLLAVLVSEIERAYKLWQAGGLAELYEELGSRDFLRGRRITAEGSSGLAIGIDRSGRLEVELNGKRRLIESGEIAYER